MVKLSLLLRPVIIALCSIFLLVSSNNVSLRNIDDPLALVAKMYQNATSTATISLSAPSQRRVSQAPTTATTSPISLTPISAPSITPLPPTSTAEPIRVQIVSDSNASLPWLSHPLLLLVVGALLSSYIIPSITRKWQERQKELELKTNLVKEISQAVAGVTMTVEFFGIGAIKEHWDKQEYFKNLRDWETRQSMIQSQLQAYFQDDDISSQWLECSTLLTEVFSLCSIDDVDQRKVVLARIRQRINEAKVDWAILEQGRVAWTQNFIQYQQTLSALKEALRIKTNAVITAVLKSQITLHDVTAETRLLNDNQ